MWRCGVSTSFQSGLSEADLVSQGILIIARLGASFLALENRGIRTIVNAMARHRSDKEQRGRKLNHAATSYNNT